MADYNGDIYILMNPFFADKKEERMILYYVFDIN